MTVIKQKYSSVAAPAWAERPVQHPENTLPRLLRALTRRLLRVIDGDPEQTFLIKMDADRVHEQRMEYAARVGRTWF